jgi:hypothetical protein
MAVRYKVPVWVSASRPVLATAGADRASFADSLDWVAFSPGDAQMDYRVYIVGQSGRFTGVQEIEAPDDKAALRKAKQYAGERDVEVWQQGRHVGRIASADQNPVVKLALRRIAHKLEKT